MRSFKNKQRYVGIDKDVNGGMTHTAKIIRNAWAFGIIPETETCEGWMPQGIDDLWNKVQEEWSRYEFQVSRMPDDIRERFMRIQDDAIKRARTDGWDPELSEHDD